MHIISFSNLRLKNKYIIRETQKKTTNVVPTQEQKLTYVVGKSKIQSRSAVFFSNECHVISLNLFLKISILNKKYVTIHGIARVFLICITIKKVSITREGAHAA